VIHARIASVRIERRRDGGFADTSTPRLSWVVSSAHSWRQAGVDLMLDGGVSVTLATAESVLVDWPFDPLQPHSRCTLQVRATSTEGTTTPWSEPVEVRTTFMAEGEWIAEEVALAGPVAPATPGLLRLPFDVDGTVAEATLFATASGVYQASVNGADVDDAVLKPGWTAYQYRRVHESTDVTALLRQGRNVLGLRIAGGWWTEEFGYYGNANRFYGDQPAVAAQLRIRLTDGRVQTVATDERVRAAAAGHVVSSGLYQGEHVDARRAVPGWDLPEHDDSRWPSAVVVRSGVVPEPAIAEPIRRTEEIPVRSVLISPSGTTVLDFGQNLVGRLRLQVRGPRGTQITVRHAESLLYGELDVAQLRAASSIDTFELSGGDDVLEPEFTFHGFRYAEVSGWPGALDPRAITAVVIGTDMERTGWFSSSDPLLDRFHENVVWGMRGNFVSIPTDCPQRDERLGWTGDIQVFGPTAAALADCDGFLASWLRDVAAEQAASDGVCPTVVPQVLHDGLRPVAVWGDAATSVPWVLYERFGDTRALAEQYPSMRDWVDVELGLLDEANLWEGMFQFGDWLDPNAPAEKPEDSPTPSGLVATASVVRSARLVARAAAVLGHEDDARRYAERAEQVRQAWVAAYTDGTRTVCDTQTSYALAIMFDLVDSSTACAMGARLAELVREVGTRVGTGFAGTPILLDALTRTGHAELAGELMLQTQAPGWLFAVAHGATTVWERWQPLLPDGNLDPEIATSLNHYALGAVADWLHRSVAGLAPAAPGYRELRIAPVPIAGLQHADVRRETPYGPAAAGWFRTPDGLHVHALVPANTTATVALPGRAEMTVRSGHHTWVLPGAAS
jgi:alpha-L-rhamnosidase